MIPANTRFITLLVQKHMALLGATAALSRARTIPGLTVAENGDVLHVTGDPAIVNAELENTYASFAGKASRIITHALKERDLDRI
ncbi:hypothetical protein A2Z10_00700 [Candidatus Azambacteria bacterium RBG_16_47_10]|uniref:Uncharacterized protein n=1 Tax=Candidatus Azambacteria bacterium RBG_16_47_10 TaxID=1797292 RepID=A0A1F5AYV5_9BACT|nr:MAG: hypothetical protein A2Z10_00700 [Candidatus Azambacteria bacterium RBG_16_47_10]